MWCFGWPNVEKRYAQNYSGPEVKRFFGFCQSIRKEPDRTEALCHLVNSQLLASHVTHLAQRLPADAFSILAHIAWQFDGRYGLPPGIISDADEVQSWTMLFSFFSDIQEQYFVVTGIFNKLFSLHEKQDPMDRANFEKKQRFKRKVESLIWFIKNTMEDGECL